jgi:hypothetical protein
MAVESLDIFKFLVPAASPFPLIRIGPNGDGAYLMPDDFKGICCCFSVSLRTTKQFEDHLANCYGIKSYIANHISALDQLGTPLISGYQFYHQISIGSKCPDGATSRAVLLEQWVDRYSSNLDSDLILQMDIEGGEYDALLPAPAFLISRFRIIVIEIHGMEGLVSPDCNSSDVYLLLEKLSRTHICIHLHPNNCSGQVVDSVSGMNVPSVMQLTYLRRDRFEGADESSLVGPFLPHPLDIPRNVLCNRPLVLNHAWSSGGFVHSISREKTLSDLVEYLHYHNDESVRSAQAEASALRGELDAALARSELLSNQIEDLQCLCINLHVSLRTLKDKLNWNRAQLNLARNFLVGYRRLFQGMMSLWFFP